MNKQFGDANEMIEEIEQFLARKILGGKAWNTRDIAEGVYGLLAENAVVLAKEEYERLLKEETLCERLGNDIDVKLKYIYELEDKVAQVHKETAEKIWNKAKNNFVGFDRISLKLLYFIIEKDIGVDLNENVDEICK